MSDEVKQIKFKYSGGSNSEHSNTESIRKPNILKVRFRMVNHLKTELQNGRFTLGRFTLYK